MALFKPFMACVLLLSAVAARAADIEPSHFRLALSLGSLGIGPEVTYRPNRWFGIRGSATFLSVDPHAKIDQIDYRARLRLKNYGMTGDLYPFGNGWRLSAGVREDSNRMKLQAAPMMPITIGGQAYTPAEVGTLSGEITTGKYAPVLTFGYGGRAAKGFSIGGDAGVMVQGRPRIDGLDSTTMVVTPADLAREQGTIQRKINRYRVYPILQISAGYRF